MFKTESLGLEEAKLVVEAMLQEAMKDPRQPVAMAVVDRCGDLVYFARMDGANRFNQEMATRKAVTATQVGVDTSMFRQALPGLKMGLGDFGADITVVPGGLCVRKPDTGVLLGGIGVSGRLAEDDEKLARVGMGALKAK
ncbi:MAG: heme-binding protein [Chloroflexi bacterium]|nr:heme-binding protein [Chloroflexota bacterium]